MIGLGLLEMIPEADILAHADPEDLNRNGIAGRPNRVWSAAEGKVTLGRFGWKAGMASIPDQTATAFAGDIGLSTYLVPPSHSDCMPAQRGGIAAPGGDDPAGPVAPLLRAVGCRPMWWWGSANGKVRLGCFCLRAGMAILPDQTAMAFAGDIGLST